MLSHTMTERGGLREDAAMYMLLGTYPQNQPQCAHALLHGIPREAKYGSGSEPAMCKEYIFYTRCIRLIHIKSSLFILVILLSTCPRGY